MKRIKYIAILLVLVPSITANANSLTYVDDETPIEVQFACDKYGEQYNICPEFLEAICWKESRYQEDATDNTGSCYGVMQIHAKSHSKRIKKLEVSDLLDIDSNVHVGADYLAELFETYEDAGLVLMIYHGEKGAIKKAESGNISDYALEILEKSEELERLHGK